MVSTVRRRRLPFVLGTIGVLLVALFLLWDWNWFRPIVERVASAKLHREVRIGHLSLKLLTRQPRLVLTDLSIADPPDDPAKGQIATVGEFDLQIDAVSAFHHQWVIDEIRFERPVIELHRYGDNQTNYAFTSGGDTTTSGAPPQIEQLIVDDGHIHLADPTLKADVKLAIDTPLDSGKRMFRVNGDGTYAGQAIVARFLGGAVLDLQDTDHPYPIDFDLKNGHTHLAAKGTVLDPIHFAGANVTLLAQGDDLADIYPLTGVPIPSTPPYKLTGALDAKGSTIHFDNFVGSVGQSDLEGSIGVTPGKERPFITADMQSRKVVLADLAGFIGNAPGSETAPTSTPVQRQKKANEEANAPLLPTTPINLPKLRAADLKVHYVGKRIESNTTPLDDLDARIAVEDGTIRLEPLKFGMGQGAIAINLALNGQQNQVHAKGDITVEHVDLKRIMEDLKPFKGTGIIGGRADIDTVGNSPAAMMANGNGNASITMSGGNLSALLQDLGGLEVGRAVYRYLGSNEQTPVNCMVADVGLKKGIMSTKTFVLDTDEENLYLSGTIDFPTQDLDLKLTSEAKHFSVLSVKAPIDISGSMKSPSVGPDAAALAKRGVPAAVLGVVLTPVASLLMTVQLGGSTADTGCKDLLNTVRRNEAAQARTKEPAMPPPGHPSSG